MRKVTFLYRSCGTWSFALELMSSYTIALLGAVSEFIAAVPVIYLFAIFCLLGIVKVFRQLLS